MSAKSNLVPRTNVEISNPWHNSSRLDNESKSELEITASFHTAKPSLKSPRARLFVSCLQKYETKEMKEQVQHLKGQDEGNWTVLPNILSRNSARRSISIKKIQLRTNHDKLDNAQEHKRHNDSSRFHWPLHGLSVNFDHISSLLSIHSTRLWHSEFDPYPDFGTDS